MKYFSILLCIWLANPHLHAQETLTVEGFGLNTDVRSLPKKYPNSDHSFSLRETTSTPGLPFRRFNGKEYGRIPEYLQGTYSLEFADQERKGFLTNVSLVFEEDAVRSVSFGTKESCEATKALIVKKLGRFNSQHQDKAERPSFHAYFWDRPDVAATLICTGPDLSDVQNFAISRKSKKKSAENPSH